MPRDGSFSALDELHNIKLHSVEDRGMVIVRVEEIYARKERFDYRQAGGVGPSTRCGMALVEHMQEVATATGA